VEPILGAALNIAAKTGGMGGSETVEAVFNQKTIKNIMFVYSNIMELVSKIKNAKTKNLVFIEDIVL